MGETVFGQIVQELLLILRNQCPNTSIDLDAEIANIDVITHTPR